MRLSRRCRYGVRALIALAVEGEGAPVSIKIIAERERIPVPFLQQLFFRLKKAGMVKSVRGPGGGFTLARAPEKVPVLDILQALGEGVDVTECVAEDRKTVVCKLAKQCAPRALWQKLEEAVRGVLGGTTLADLCEQKRELRIRK
ncbi:MAG: Rrf2 family transcriptional regulator [Planctomycetota bacterium]